jgi:hypothetical protein
MQVGNQNADTAKSPPAAMPVPGTSAFEQLRVGPSTEMSLRKSRPATSATCTLLSHVTRTASTTKSRAA